MFKINIKPFEFALDSGEIIFCRYLSDEQRRDLYELAKQDAIDGRAFANKLLVCVGFKKNGEQEISLLDEFVELLTPSEIDRFAGMYIRLRLSNAVNAIQRENDKWNTEDLRTLFIVQVDFIEEEFKKAYKNLVDTNISQTFAESVGLSNAIKRNKLHEDVANAAFNHLGSDAKETLEALKPGYAVRKFLEEENDRMKQVYGATGYISDLGRNAFGTSVDRIFASEKLSDALALSREIKYEPPMPIVAPLNLKNPVLDVSKEMRSILQNQLNHSLNMKLVFESSAELLQSMSAELKASQDFAIENAKAANLESRKAIRIATFSMVMSIVIGLLSIYWAERSIDAAKTIAADSPTEATMKKYIDKIQEKNEQDRAKWLQLMQDTKRGEIKLKK